MTTPNPTLQRAVAAGFASSCFFFTAAISNAQTFDPTIFDGSHTVIPGTINQRGDDGTGPSGDWQDDSLTVYGPDGQSQQPWGVQTQMPGMPGMQGMQIPGMEGMQGMQGQGGMGGMGGLPGLPPLMGGGGGGQGQEQIPPGMEGMQGQNMEGEGNGGKPPPGAKSTGEPPPDAAPSDSASQANGGEAPDGPSVDVPEDMKIGDENQKIQQAQAQTPQDQGETGDTSGDEAGEQEGSQDPTRMEAAGGKQSGKRGGGDESGVAIPADL